VWDDFLNLLQNLRNFCKTLDFRVVPSISEDSFDPSLVGSAYNSYALMWHQQFGWVGICQFILQRNLLLVPFIYETNLIPSSPQQANWWRIRCNRSLYGSFLPIHGLDMHHVKSLWKD
jgi:hypothetical protein